MEVICLRPSFPHPYIRELLLPHMHELCLLVCEVWVVSLWACEFPSLECIRLIFRGKKIPIVEQFGNGLYTSRIFHFKRARGHSWVSLFLFTCVDYLFACIGLFFLLLWNSPSYVTVLSFLPTRVGHLSPTPLPDVNQRIIIKKKKKNLGFQAYKRIFTHSALHSQVMIIKWKTRERLSSCMDCVGLWSRCQL